MVIFYSKQQQQRQKQELTSLYLVIREIKQHNKHVFSSVMNVSLEMQWQW